MKEIVRHNMKYRTFPSAIKSYQLFFQQLKHLSSLTSTSWLQNDYCLWLTALPCPRNMVNWLLFFKLHCNVTTSKMYFAIFSVTCCCFWVSTVLYLTLHSDITQLLEAECLMCKSMVLDILWTFISEPTKEMSISFLEKDLNNLLKTMLSYPKSMVSVSTVSLTHRQVWSKNIQWNTTEMNNS